MRDLRTTGMGLALALLVAACGSKGGGSTEPGASSEPSSAPSAAASQDGTGSGVDFGDGSVKFELSGAATKSGEFGYAKGLGVIDPSGQQIALTFVDAAGTASVTINSGSNGAVVHYADQDIGALLAPVGTVLGECSVRLDQLEAKVAKGTFRCEHMAIIQGGETLLGEGTLSGSFEARD